MPFETAIGASPIAWDQEFYWPDAGMRNPGDDPLNLQLNRMRFPATVKGDANSAFFNTPGQLMDGGGSSGVPSFSMGLEDNVWCFRGSALVGGQALFNVLNGAAAFNLVPTNAGLVAPLPTMPSFMRGYWLRVLVKATGVLDLNQGFGVVPWGTQTGSYWPSEAVAAAQSGGMAVVGDGVGGFRYRAYDSAAAVPGSILEDIAISPAVMPNGQWAQLDFIMQNSRPSANASFELRVNGSTIVSRNWLGGLLPLYSQVGSNRACFTPAWRFQFTLGGSFAVGGLEVKKGRFTPEGVEIF